MRRFALLLPLAVFGILLFAGATAQDVFHIRNGDTAYVNRSIICVVENGGIYCALKGNRGFAVFLNQQGASISRVESGRSMLICIHARRCSG